MKRTLNYTIPEEFDGCRVDSVLRTHFQISGSLLKELKQSEDGLLLNGTRTRSIDTVKTSDVIEINIYDSASENIVPVELPLNIIYEDEDIIIVSKQPSMPTHPSIGNFSNTLANGLMYYFSQKGEEHTFRAVNRLDKDTSGLMCIAKNKYAHARLCGDLRNKRVHRKYRAIVLGVTDEYGTIDVPIKRESDSVIKRIAADDGDCAVTHYKRISAFGVYSLVELELETGRTHQIRVHMSHIGHPLLGDWLYGEENHELFPRQALHSCYLSLTHPVTGELLRLESELPDDMKSFIKKFS